MLAQNNTSYIYKKMDNITLFITSAKFLVPSYPNLPN